MVAWNVDGVIKLRGSHLLRPGCIPRALLLGDVEHTVKAQGAETNGPTVPTAFAGLFIVPKPMVKNVTFNEALVLECCQSRPISKG